MKGDWSTFAKPEDATNNRCLKEDELQDLSFNPPSGEQDPLVLMLTRIVSFEGIPGCEHRIMDSYPIQPMEDDLHSVIGQCQRSLTWRHLRCLRFMGSPVRIWGVTQTGHVDTRLLSSET